MTKFKTDIEVAMRASKTIAKAVDRMKDPTLEKVKRVLVQIGKAPRLAESIPAEYAQRLAALDGKSSVQQEAKSILLQLGREQKAAVDGLTDEPTEVDE